MKNSEIPSIHRILMSTDCVGGVWTYSLELAKSLQDYNVEVVLATMGAVLSADQREAVKKIQNIKLFESSFKLEWMEDPWNDVEASGQWLLKIEEMTRPDLIHLNSYAHGSLPFRAPKIVVGHSCVFSWHKAVRKTEPDNKWQKYREAVTLGLQSADMAIAPSGSMLAELERYYSLPQRTEVVYNGRDAADFIPAQKEEIILAAGRLWDEAKNVAAVGAAASRLDWPVILAGDNVNPDGGVKTFSGVKHLGRISQNKLSELMGRASIYAFPARYEPFGLSILEAALAGCALVLGDIPSLREIWGENAYFVHPDDHDQLEYTINGLIKDAALRRKIAGKSRIHALRYSARKTAESYMKAYNDLMNMKYKAAI